MLDEQINRKCDMTEHNLFYYPYASFTDAQLPLLKVAASCFDRLVILDPVGAGWATGATSSGVCGKNGVDDSLRT